MFFNKGNKELAKQGNAQDPLIAFDIGSSKIRLIAAEVSDDSVLHVSYYNEVPSSGMINGAVSDINKLANKLSTLVQEYTEDTGNRIEHCVIGIAGRHIDSTNAQGSATVPTRKVTEEDRLNALSSAKAHKFTENRHLIHAIPQCYMTDSSLDISNPIGMSTVKLNAAVHLIVCNEDQENNIRAAFELMDANIKIDHVIFDGIAAADAVLSQEEKEIGVCLIDFGGGAINVAVYSFGKLVLTFGFDFGGQRITREIATQFGLPLAFSEFIKKEYAYAHTKLLPPEELKTRIKLELPKSSINGQSAQNGGSDSGSGEGETELVYIRYPDLVGVISIAIRDILQQINNRLESYNYDNSSALQLGAGFVFTGGSSNIVGLPLLAHALMVKDSKNRKQRVKARVGTPIGVEIDDGVNDKYRDDVISPDCATVIGLIRVAHDINQNKQLDDLAAAERKRNSSSCRKVFNWARDW